MGHAKTPHPKRKKLLHPIPRCVVGAPGLCGQHIPHLGTLLPLVHRVIREAVAFEWRYRGGQDSAPGPICGGSSSAAGTRWLDACCLTVCASASAYRLLIRAALSIIPPTLFRPSWTKDYVHVLHVQQITKPLIGYSFVLFWLMLSKTVCIEMT